MGRDKAAVRVAGRTMLDWVMAALIGAGCEPLVVGQEATPTTPAVPDDLPAGRGPLAGLATALRIGGGAVVLVAVDQPWVRSQTISALVATAGHGAAVPTDGGARQVTCAVYPAAWASTAAAELEAGGSIQSLLDRLPHQPVRPEAWGCWGEDGRSWFSADRPEDLAEGLRRFGPPGAR